MENTASTRLFFTFCVTLHQTKENDTEIVTVALFCQKICLKKLYLAAILNLLSKPEVVITTKGTCVLGDIKLDETKP